MSTTKKNSSEKSEPIKKKMTEDQEIRFPEASLDATEPSEPVEAKEQAGQPQEIGVDELRSQMEKMHLDEATNAQAQSTAQSMKLLQEEEKIKNLLALAKTKGVMYAIKVAQKMNDAYLLDLLHDRLVKGGHYKDLT